MKKNILSILTLFIFVIIASSQTNQPQNLYDFKVTDIDGKEFDMASLKGKKVMIVNVASKCGLTPQYKQLQELYEEYGNNDFVIIGFPANNFKNQEPGTNEEIKEFCSLNYGVTFPIMEKISVAGDDKAPIYRWLTEKSRNGLRDQEVTWNFQKFLISKEGNLEHIVMPKEIPKSEVIIKWLEGD